jgi:hypothetical protein
MSDVAHHSLGKLFSLLEDLLFMLFKNSLDLAVFGKNYGFIQLYVLSMSKRISIFIIEWLIIQKVLDVLFDVLPTVRVSLKLNDSLLIHQQNMRYPLNPIEFITLRTSFYVVLYLLIPLFFDARHDLVMLLVDAHADDPDLISPVFAVLLKKVVVMFHGLLTGRTPGGPEVYHHHFAFFMFDRDFIETIGMGYIH